MAFSNQALFSTTAVSFILAASTSIAQVSPEDVWTAWSGFAEQAGYSVEVADTDSSGDRLTLSGLTFSFQEGTTEFEALLDEMVLVGQGDGSVVVTYSEGYDAVVRDSSFDGEIIEIPLAIDVSNATTTVSGTPDNMRNDVVANSVTVAINSDIPGDEAVDLVARVEMTDIGGFVTMGGDAMEQDMTASKLTLSARFSDPDNPADYADIAATLNNVTTKASGPMAAIGAFSGMSDIIGAGSGAQSKFTYTDAKYAVRGQGDGEDFVVEAMLGPGSVAASLSETGITYDVEGNDLDTTITSSDMPGGGAGFSADQAAWSVSLPFDEAQGAKELGINVNFKNVAFSDGLWALMDPFGAFPRAPASLSFDIALGGDLVTTALDQGLAGEEITEFVGEDGTLDIRDFEFSFGDLKLSANGSASTDGADPASMTLPTGKLNLELVGANGFLDNLEANGPIPPAQLAAVRGMLSFFGRPGAGPDTIVSVIEFSPAGILANGVPLPFSP